MREEDFKEAARLKAMLNEATASDPVFKVLTELTVYELSRTVVFYWLD